MKICTVCGNEYPATYEHFVKRLHWKTGSPIVGGMCVYCNRARSKAWAKKNPERFRLAQNKSSRNAYAKNREYHKKRRKEWEANLTEEGKTALRERMRMWIRSNPEQVIKRRIHALMSRSLRGNKNGASWESLVGYTTEELMAHLESKFKDGMSWENRRMWHIDHIRPVVSFTYRSPDDQGFKECWSLINLQPLWAFDNMSKGSKVA